MTDADLIAQRIRDAIDDAIAAELRAARRRRPAYVYAIRAGRYVKVGRSVNVEARATSLARAHKGTRRPADLGPCPTTILATICVTQDEAPAVEAELLERFRRYRAAGEWLDASPEVLAWAAAQGRADA